MVFEKGGSRVNFFLPVIRLLVLLFFVTPEVWTYHFLGFDIHLSHRFAQQMFVWKNF